MTFTSKTGFSYKTPLGFVRVYAGEADGKRAVVIKIESNEGDEKHNILVSEEGACALAGLIQLATSFPEEKIEMKTKSEEAA